LRMALISSGRMETMGGSPRQGRRWDGSEVKGEAAGL